MQSDKGLHLRQLPRPLLRIHAPTQLALAPREILLRQLAHRLNREGPRTQRRLTHRQVQDLLRARCPPILIQQLGQRLLHRETRQHLRGVEGRRALPVPAREPVDELALLIGDVAALARHLILHRHEVLLLQALHDVLGHHPRALRGVPARRHLPQALGGEGTRVAHEPLVDSAQLVDAQLHIGDEATAALAVLLSQQQVAQHPQQRPVAQAHLVNEGGRRRAEEVSAHRPEDQTIEATLVGGWHLLIVALIDQAEQPVQGLIDMRARLGRLLMQLPQGQFAQTIQAVAGVVLGGAHRQDPQFGARLRIQQEDDPVDVAQRLQSQVLRPLLGQRLQPPRGAPAHHLIRKDLNGGAHALTQILRDPHRVGRRVLQGGRPPRLALRRRQQRTGIQAGQGPLHLAAARRLIAFDDELHVHRQPAALRPPLPLRHQRPLARQDQGESRTVPIRHERRQGPRHRLDRLSPLQRRGVGVP